MSRHVDRLLRRQGLDRSTPPSPAEWASLLGALDAGHEHRQRERYLTQRAQRLASAELAHATDEARRRASELHAILDSLVEGLCVVGRDGRVRVTNPSARWLLGAIEPGAPIAEVVAGLQALDGDCLVDVLVEACTTEAAVDIAHAVLERDSTRHLSIKGMSVPEQGTTVLSFVDISDVVAADASRADLERRVGHQQRLESIGRLAGSVAHDFNNLLAGIVSCVDLLEDDVTGDALDDVSEIRRAAKRGADLTRRLLAFSRQEPSDPVPVDVSEAVESLEGLLRRLVPRRDALRSRRSDLDCTVSCDPIDLEQIVMNLVLNGRDAIDDDGSILVETERVRLDPNAARELVVSPGDYVRITVTDDGVGMSADVVARALDPFFTTKAAGEGNGLGLSTVQTLVARAGGTVQLDSTPGRGTSALVYLPAVRPARRHDDGEPDTVGGRASALRVLIVDDEPAVLAQARRTVESLGHDVDVAASASEARVRFDHHDIVLCDVFLGDANGVELGEELQGRVPSTSVVLMSGVPSDRRRGVATGLLVEKPFSAPEVAAAFAAANFAVAAGSANDG
ncbi:MAG: ATP-binding protein [Acidimicrobiales bacterium]